MTNPSATSGSEPTDPATPQTLSAPERTRKTRACHVESFSTRGSYAAPDDEQPGAAGRFRISCLTIIIDGGSMAAEDIFVVDAAIVDVDIVAQN
jgi:hypothetical protein